MRNEIMIDIKDIQGTTRFSTKINPGAKGKFSLMKEDYVVLPFSSTSPVDFQVGDYVDLRGVFDASMGGKLAKIYQIVDLSYPTYNASTGGYDYELRLDAYYWIWKTKIFKYTPETGGQEASWSLTASLDVQMGVFLRNLKALGYTYGGKNFTFSIDSTVENKAVAMTYENMNLIDAMFSMAEKWGCDCWVADHVINFGRCEFSDAVKIELGKEAKDISRSDSKGTYATRIFAFGSTRNIPTNYRPVDQTAVVNGIVQKRLMLPAGTPYVDAYEGMNDYEAIEAVVVFDDIYPKRVGEITDVSSYESEVDNEDGTKTKATFYRFTDTGINFSKEYILEGQELKIKFESGKLNGMEFGVAFNPLGLTEKNDDDSWNPDAQLWEIVQNEDYGRPLPDEVLLPKIGDKYVLSGWNAEKITELGLTTAAEEELLAAAKKFVAKTCIDDGTYTATLNSIWVHNDQINHSFDVGQRINLINPAYFKAGRKSRVIGFEINLDLPYDSPQYTIGESTAYSRLSDIETQVEELTFKGQTFTGSGGSNIYVIKTNDSTAASNFNVFSALRTLSMFLRKDATDVAAELITFLKGMLIGKNGSGITVRKDGTTQAVVDRLYVKIKAVFEELQVKKATHVGGEQIISHAGMKCIRVEELEGVYRCYFLAEQDGEAIANEFSIGSLAQAKECNIVEGTTLNASNRYYWREVMKVGRDYIDLSKTICDKDSDIPQAGDDIIGLGHRKDVDLQSAIVLSSTNETAPSITFYAGINDFNLTEKDVISFGVDKATGHAYMKVYGTSYIGARDESTYIKYTPKDGVEIKGKFLSIATGKSFDGMISSLQFDLDLIKEQTDKEYTLWFFEYAPTLTNIPAFDWTTDELKTLHEQDMFYNRASGLAYRFVKSDSTWEWADITDQQTIKALENASKAQDTADSKRRVFVEQPTKAQAYDIGDLWVNATYSDDNVSYKNDTLVCKIAKAKGEAFSISHWKPASTATTAYLENLGNQIIIAVSNANDGIDAAKELARQGISDALNASLNALDALGIAREAQGTADENTAAILVNERSITSLVNGIHFDASGNITNINTSGLITEDDFNALLSKKVSFDAEGHITNISTSGLVTELGFAQMFSERAEAEGYVKKSYIATFITELPDGSFQSNAIVDADLIRFNGNIVANDTFVVDKAGNLTLNSITAKDITLSGTIDGVNARLDNITANNISLSGTINGINAILNDITANNLTLSGTINGANAVLNSITAKDITLSGTINGTNARLDNITANNISLSGTINGINATLDSITAKNLTLSGTINGANAILNDITANNLTLSGTINGANAILNDIVLNNITANSGTFKGEVIADSGTIGGFKITDSSIGSETAGNSLRLTAQGIEFEEEKKYVGIGDTLPDAFGAGNMVAAVFSVNLNEFDYQDKGAATVNISSLGGATSCALSIRTDSKYGTAINYEGMINTNGSKRFGSEYGDYGVTRGLGFQHVWDDSVGGFRLGDLFFVDGILTRIQWRSK